MRAGERKNLVHDNRACELGVKLENHHTWDVTFLKATRIERFLSLYNSFLSDATCCCWKIQNLSDDSWFFGDTFSRYFAAMLQLRHCSHPQSTYTAPHLKSRGSSLSEMWEVCVCVCGSVRVWEGAVCALLPFRSASFLPGQAAAWKCKPFTTPSFWHTQTHISWDVWFKRAQMKPCLLSHR